MGCRKLNGSIFRLVMMITVFAILVLITGESSAGDSDDIAPRTELVGSP